MEEAREAGKAALQVIEQYTELHPMIPARYISAPNAVRAAFVCPRAS